MADIVRTEANSLDNPQVLFAWQPESISGTAVESGFFQPLDTLSFRLLRPDGTELLGSTIVDPTDPANQLDASGDGRIIVLPFTIAGGEPVGVYTAEVTFVAHPVGLAALAAQTVTFPFRVLDQALGFEPNVYAQLQDMIDQGFPVAATPPAGGYSLVQGRDALRRASRYIDRVTRRGFMPAYGVQDLNGRGGSILQVSRAIVGLTSVAFTFSDFNQEDLLATESSMRVYNRHMRQNLTRPDDRDDPRVEFLGSSASALAALLGGGSFPASQQNVQLRGVWGYSDYDGSPFGKIPDLVVELTLRLAARFIGNLWTAIGGAGAQSGTAGPTLVERTLDQSIEYANLSWTQGPGAYAGAFTGDPAIDQLLVMFMAPPRFGSA